MCCALAACMHQKAPVVDVYPKHFNIQIPFGLFAKGILIDTYWGADQVLYKLYLDNHSPTWANEHIIHYNPSISKSKDFLYSTTTADGKAIAGDVYVCDNIRLGGVHFKNVSFYNISNPSNAGKADGVIGENIMNKGVWKIDFTHQQLQFASSIDSVKGLEEAELLTAEFTDNAIEIKIAFRNAITETLELDLGYNGAVILPAEMAKPIFYGNTKIYTDSMQFSTPGGTAAIKNSVANDKIEIGGRNFNTFITSNEMVREKLIGLRFFNSFNFIVIDYLNKAVYVSKKTINE